MASPQSPEISLKREFYEIEGEGDLLERFSTSPSPESLQSSPASTVSPEPSQAPTDSSTTEKKPVKKRKSWGQELPTPTTNLPPRKRAKTEAEKEQRRIERVLRNRAAAQSSRERKRKEVEALEDVKNSLADDNKALRATNSELLARVESIAAQNRTLQLELQRLRETIGGGKFTPERSPIIQPLLTPSSISNDSFVGTPSEISTPPSMDGTLDPSQLSTPCKSDEDPFSMTQHTAVMLCSKDLPCQLTGPSMETQVMLAIMSWTLYLASAISVGPLLEVVMYMVTSTQIPDSELTRLFPSILFLTTLTKTQSFASRLATISPTCALLLDATSSVRWFGTASASELGISKWMSRMEDEEKEGDDPARVCRKFVMGLHGKGGQDYGPTEVKELMVNILVDKEERPDGIKGGGRDGTGCSSDGLSVGVC